MSEEISNISTQNSEIFDQSSDINSKETIEQSSDIRTGKNLVNFDKTITTSPVLPETINYTFIFYVYLSSSAICILLLVLEKIFLLGYLKGAWIVFAPFIPCSLFAFFKRSKDLPVDIRIKKDL